MGQHFLLHRELVAATAVHHAVYAHLTNDIQPDLVVACPQYLRIYRIEPFQESTDHVLHLMASFPLAGVIESMHVVTFDRNLLAKKQRFHGGSDVLVLSFSLFKCVVIGFDRKSRSLATLAMFSFEDTAIGPGATLKGERNGRNQLMGLSSQPIVKMDPQGRCGAMLIYADQLVILPLRSQSMDLVFEEDDDDVENLKEEDEDEEERRLQELVKSKDHDVDQHLKSLLDKSVKVGSKRKRHAVAGLLSNELVGREFLLQLRELEPPIVGKIIDMVFLDGYLEPTLMLLHEENERTATDGRLASGYDTMCLTVLSINLNSRLHPKIWSVRQLPSDCFQLIACPSPIGGALVLSTNAVMYFNQTQFYGRATNVFADKTVNQTVFPLEKQEDQEENPLNLLLYDCQSAHLSPMDVLLTTANGEMFVVGLPHGSKPSLSLRKVTMEIPVASCICVDQERKTMFVGSRSGDSILFAFDYDHDGEQREIQDHDVEMDEASAEEDPEEDETDQDDDEDDVFLYGSAAARSLRRFLRRLANGTNDAITLLNHMEANGTTSASKQLEFRQIDALPSIGQITAADMGVETNVDSKEKREQLVVSGGYLNHGALSVLHHGLRPIVGTEAELSGCRAMWTVKSSLSEKTSRDGRVFDSYLILSVAQRTMVLKTGEGMEPLEEDCGFYTSGPTLTAANLFDRKRIVQVFKQGARVMAEVPIENPAEEDEEEEMGVKLECTQEITLEGDVECGGMDVDTSSVSIVSVDVLDPYILLLLTDGTIRLLVGDDDLELRVVVPSVGNGITSVCLFYDDAGMFHDDAWGDHDDQDDESPEVEDSNPAKEEDQDEEMEALYTTSAKPKRQMHQEHQKAQYQKKKSSMTTPLLNRSDALMMCGVCYDDGSLHVFQLPDFVKKGVFPYLTFAPQVLINTLEHFESSDSTKKVTFRAPVLGLNASSATTNEGRIKKSHTINSPVADLVIQRIGPSASKTNGQLIAKMVLFVFLANGDLLLYAALPQYPSVKAYQFVRMHSELITRPLVAPASKVNHHEMGNSESNTAAVVAKLRGGFRYPMLTKFSNVNNQSGVFFRGAHPMWILSERGLPTLVPMAVNPTRSTSSTGTLSVPVLSFTPFHHWNCPNGFIYFHSSGFLRLCELPSSKTTSILPSSGGFVLHKVDLGATVHDVLYMGEHGPGGVTEALETPTYAVVLSRKMKPEDAEKATFNEENQEEEEPTSENEDPAQSNVMAPTAEMFPDFSIDQMAHTEEDLYEIRLVQTNEFGEWERRGVFRVYFERYEVVLSVKVMYLYDSSMLKEEITSTSDEWHKKKRPYLIVGTGYVGPHGEDESGKGRLLVYELDYAQYVGDTGDASKKLPKLKLVFIKLHFQGAITMVRQLGPFVLVAVGNKLIVYEYKAEQLIGCAFFDAQMYIASVSVIKDFILYGDVFKSVYFVRWKEKQRQLVLLAKDYEPLAVTATEFNVFEKRLALVASDMEANVHVLQFAPNDIESRGGQRLLRTSDFHVGAQVSCMFRKSIGPMAYINVLGTSEGSVGVLVPVPERVFRRLFTLQNVMINTLPQCCALNPREFRVMKSNGERRTGRFDAWCKQKWKKGFLDGQVLLQFVRLDYVAQKELARCIGTTPEVILHNLLEIQTHATQFL